ncbi:MAG: hypothetical protein E7Z91_01410 [Cyanobacteria bacterium SIG30]|nr:hypothetical protein [Cyanobacteria bacterium SIG30]
MNKKIAITTGDKKGIGKELVEKALLKLNLPKENVVIIGEKIDALNYETIEIKIENNGDFCFESLKVACNLAKEGKISAIVTSPVSKKVLHDAGHFYNGQTEVIEEHLKKDKDKAEMMFITNDLRIMLLTRHVALKDIKINKEMIVEKIIRLNKFLKEKCKIEKPKIGICALNPHAGENGILGDEEIKIINPAINELRNIEIDIEDAKPADSLFAKVGKKYLNNEKQDYDAVAVMYHDQGLTAVKALAFDKVVNTTIGLKVIRTSPSGGTAYDIAGKNIADSTSMQEAIKLALELS